MKVLILVVGNTLSWIVNSLSFWQMTLDMPNNEVFLLWFTLIPYILLCPLLFFDKFRNGTTSNIPEWKRHVIYILYTLLAAGDSLLEMLAGPHVGGIIQAILSASIPLPIVGILTFAILQHHFGKWEWIGSFW